MMLRATALLAVSVSLPVCAEECYTVDQSHGRVSYEVQQGGAPFRGEFRHFGGRVCLSAERVMGIDVWLDSASVDSGLPEIDAALKGKDFFAVQRYPKVTYTSQSVEAHADKEIAHGMLQMKGKRGSLDAPFTVQRKGRDLIVSGALTLNRLAYDIGTGEWSNTNWLGANVNVHFRATLSNK